MRQLVDGNVERGLIEGTQMESGYVYKFKITQSENAPLPKRISAEEWGQ